MLVGRRAEQQAIERVVAAARLGTGGVLALAGEAGVGKTVLLDHTVETLTDMRVLHATGLESERELPFGTLLQLLRPALGLLDAIPPVQAAAVAAALALPPVAAYPGPAGSDRFSLAARDRFTIGAAVLSLICRYAEEGPVAIVVDDLHLADRPSVSALVFAVRRLAADPVVVLLGVRSPEGDEVVAGLPTMMVGGLDVESARELLADPGGVPVSDERVRMLHRATEGNPLALLELGAADSAVVESVETGLPLRVPRALVNAFGRRLAGLDDECRTALLVAAVCGRDARLVTDACAARGVDAGRLGDPEVEGIVSQHGGRVEFRHPLVRAAVYSSASVHERRAAHRAAADATPPADIDRRAWHLSESVWQPDAAVADLLAQAGERAIARGAHSVASSAFERSARLSPDAAARGARLLRAADAAWTAGVGDRALTLLDQRARETSEDASGAAGGTEAPVRSDIRVIELRASIAARTGSLREARDMLLVAAERAERIGRVDDAAVALADAVHAGYYLGDARMAADLSDRLAALQPALIEPRARALGLMATGMARILAGRAGAADIRAAVPLLEADPGLQHDPRRLSWLLLAPLFLRDSASGGRLRALVDEVRGAAGIGALPAVLFHVARDQSTTGASWARAEANYSESIRLAAETGQDTELAMSLAGLAWLDSRAGRVEDCLRHGTDARARCVAKDIHIGEVWVGHAFGDLELSLGHAESAVAQLTELADLLERLQLDDADLSPAPELTDALLRLGRRDDAAAIAGEFCARAVGKGQPWARARAERAMGLVAEDADYETRCASALEWHAQTLDRFETARTQLAFGERLRRAGRRVDARLQLRTALESFSELGAAEWAEQAAAELTATGEHVRPRGASAIADLTPQELQVSLLLIDGSTTREAAAALFLSPKTVEYHLRKVYVKLGIGSRAELAAVLARK